MCAGYGYVSAKTHYGRYVTLKRPLMPQLMYIIYAGNDLETSKNICPTFVMFGCPMSGKQKLLAVVRKL